MDVSKNYAEESGFRFKSYSGTIRHAKFEVNTSPSPPLKVKNTRPCFGADLGVEISKRNLEILKVQCIQPMKACADGLKRTYQFQQIYNKKKAARDAAPEGADGIMCLQDYAEHSAIHDTTSRHSLFYCHERMLFI